MARVRISVEGGRLGDVDVTRELLAEHYDPEEVHRAVIRSALGAALDQVGAAYGIEAPR